VAKVVVDNGTSADAFSSATGTLALALSTVCQECYALVLWEELQALRQRVSGFERLEPPGLRRTGDHNEQRASPNEGGGAVASRTIVDRALAHLHQRFMDPDLSLGAVAAALECSPNHLTQRFTKLVGQHMHGYIVALRVDRACRELLGTDLADQADRRGVGFSRRYGVLSHLPAAGRGEPECVPPHLRRAMSRVPIAAPDQALRGFGL
jgi:AraC-like DNA-binding protein